MSSYRHLELPEINKAVGVLGQALSEHQVSARQKRLYRFLSWSVALIFIGYGLAAIFGLLPEANFGAKATTIRPVLMNIGMGLAGFGLLAVIPLLILNLGLVRKLWSMSRARHRLGLTEPLALAFKTERRRHRFLNLATGALVAISVMIVMFGAIGLIVSPELSVMVRVLGCLAFLVFGLAFGSLHYIRRGMERLAVVSRLHADLDTVKSEAGERVPEKTKITPAEYDIIAKLERNQITQRREESVQRAAEDSDAFGYAVQMSFAAQEAKDQLPVHEQNLVDEQIFKLVNNLEIERNRSVPDVEGDLRRLRVIDTSAEIEFRIDDADQRIQIAQIGSRQSDTSSRG